MKKSLLLLFIVLLVGCQPDIIEGPEQGQEPPQEQVTPPDTSEMMLDGACYLLDLPHKTAKVLKWAEAYSDSINLPAVVGYEGNSYRVTSIGDSAFRHCDSLTVLTLPLGLKSIGSAAFEHCSKLVAIISSAQVPPTIQDDTFRGVAASIPVYVPHSAVEAYQEDRYWGRFTGIQSFIASGTCGDDLTWRLTDRGELIIKGTGVMYDYLLDPTPWKKKYQESIAHVTIHEGVESIGTAAFSSCSSLTTVSLPEGLMKIGASAFEGCKSLISIHIPESVTSIGKQAFDGCEGLISIHIPEAMTMIDSLTFRGCTSLATVTLSESSQLTSIGGSAFENCSSLTAIHIPESTLR